MSEVTEYQRDCEHNFYLLRVSIGPVQEFISEARKTRDLYIGSFLLSLATYYSMKPLLKIHKSDVIIYPDVENLGGKSTIKNNYSIPNIYLAVVPKSDFNDLIDLMEKSLQNFWYKLRGTIGRELPCCYKTPCCHKKFYEQTQVPLFYMNWVAVEISKEELSEEYKSKLKETLDFLDERKVTRTFSQWKGDESPKCDQCGHRESLSKDFFNELRKQKKFKLRFKENEKLCSICLLKRIIQLTDIEKITNSEGSKYIKTPKFDSVVDISAEDVRKRFIKNKKEPEIRDFFQLVNKIKKHTGLNIRRGEFFYKDYLDYDSLKRAYNLIDDPQLENLCKKSQKKLGEVYKSLKIKEPSKYYIIVSMDGDDMGKFMSGDFVEDNIFTSSYQRQTSKILAGVGEKTSQKIQEGNGYSVYSGGDDVLAFLPLTKSLKVIDDVRSVSTETFTSQLSDLKKTVTSSAGIVILHHKDPLQRGLAEARKNVEEAKEYFYGKNAFFLTLRVNSGAVISWGSRWVSKYPVNNGSQFKNVCVIDFLEKFVSLMIEDPKDRLSPGFVRDLLEELPSFYEYNFSTKGMVLKSEMLKPEIQRLLKRHIPKNSRLWDEIDGDFEEIKTVNLIVELFIQMSDPDSNEYIKKEYKNKVKENFENFLKIALFLAREKYGVEID